MSAARFTLAVPGLTLDAAQELADRIDADPRLDAMAVTINETDEAASLWETVAYFAQESEAESARALLERPEALISPLPDTDWVKQSLEGLAPVAAGRFYLHGAHDRHRRRAGGISLEIDAGTAFGTGHHGTTEGCLLALDSIAKRAKPRRILDLGCGTGVLAIAAAKACGTAALATDIDPEAVRVSLLNARLNGVKPMIRGVTAAGLEDPRISAAAPFDLIFANILARPLVSLASGLSRILMPGGALILSGLTLDQTRWILATYRNRGLVPAARITRGNWAALVLTKPRPGQKSR
ncbi:50S ribosomal protein L11 methyltransferase [Aestuariivirga sp.]|uniref:50S ribosomal protein L11 methyltransferase n=1 Tax=Aestuariivirga sp. TaxID=2650926 RepID=UPI0039E54B5D